MKIQIKTHKSYRTVIAVCDSEIVGKKFEEDIKQLDLKERFYAGQEMDEDEAVEIIIKNNMEDATFNVVGEKSINAAIKAGIISEDSVLKISGIPYALKLL